MVCANFTTPLTCRKKNKAFSSCVKFTDSKGSPSAKRGGASVFHLYGSFFHNAVDVCANAGEVIMYSVIRYA